MVRCCRRAKVASNRLLPLKNEEALFREVSRGKKGEPRRAHFISPNLIRRRGDDLGSLAPTGGDTVVAVLAR
jgi:hypothetical protein